MLDEHGVNCQRIRSFPAIATSCYCMALGLYPEAAYEDVFAVVAQGLAWMQGSRAVATVAKSLISAARGKIGCAPLQALHERAGVPLADANKQPHAFYAGLRLVAIDASNFEIPDEAANAAEFGYPGSRTGHAAYPQAQCAVLAECATHAIIGANLGPYRAAEWDICKPLLSRLAPDMLCLADRSFNGYAPWKAASDTGAQLLWRCAANRQLPVIKRKRSANPSIPLKPKLRTLRPLRWRERRGGHGSRTAGAVSGAGAGVPGVRAEGQEVGRGQWGVAAVVAELVRARRALAGAGGRGWTVLRLCRPPAPAALLRHGWAPHRRAAGASGARLCRRGAAAPGLRVCQPPRRPAEG